MLLSSTSLNSSQTALYTRSGGMSQLRSEPVQRVVSTSKPTTSDEQSSEDPVTLSQEGIEKSKQQQQGSMPSSAQESETEETEGTAPTEQSADAIQELTAEEEQMVQELKQRDQEVKTHEMAHLAAAGQYAAGGASYTYQQGPDGRRYAVGGEVPIDVSEEKTPEETIQKMQAVKRAAMAPAEPSSADRSIAANATATESRARTEMQSEEAESGTDEPETVAEQSEESQSLASPTASEEVEPSEPFEAVA
ncbi:hypothetical protein JWJ90_08745 [Desulfobulbus rhabdoformis]|uniref:putative metalloprotease CJM1_0395 family protein n=1 Tax=Desulfobulbus rhabdoformis TaxID=34032 RepID=UPI0019638C86|nr:putative metalloprotease CJM1_0395 family protein [Desulfobulbus rhabdoformis]MBM9614377.1 hypothetical protein [Desulfobulbus rhabdoformis]